MTGGIMFGCGQCKHFHRGVNEHAICKKDNTLICIKLGIGKAGYPNCPHFEVVDRWKKEFEEWKKEVHNGA